MTLKKNKLGGTLATSKNEMSSLREELAAP
ncbi:hypothetical protein BIW11_02830 [Tropilaelaps mercedesae]|uniref:Uncharacterized protein n=1 Tax=Tropilaelaps mercedesae TaxID=418985 RepID=A0A1V9XX12_9ACAR|nr:hypothetical protein BIW11_02830 [Tropilaelaps mercedesae]